MPVQTRMGAGWQYALADLSLILFMVCAAALAQRPAAPKAAAPAHPPPAHPAPVAALADPVAVWRAGPGAPSLDGWLAGQPLDPRQRLTIVARYSGGQAQAAFARAQTVLRGAGRLPAATRIVVEPAGTDDVSATLTWDGASG